MTIPIIRKRAKKPKTRTGCHTCRSRHVKCDETKPTCIRCSKAGRICCGYPSNKDVGSYRPAFVLPKPIESIVCRNLSPRESSFVDLFRSETAYQLPGSSWALSWPRMVLQHVDSRNPAITHIAIALGSLHLSRSQGFGPLDYGYDYGFALEQCNKSMSHLCSYIEQDLHGKRTMSEANAEVVVLASFLFFCFEVWSSRSSNASIHLRSGLRLLYDHCKTKSVDAEDQYHVILETTPRSSMSMLLQAGVRLDQDLIIVHKGCPLLNVTVSDPLPLGFSNLEEALVHLNSVTSKVHDLSAKLHKTTASLLAKDEDLETRYPCVDQRLCYINAHSRFISLDAHPGLCKAIADAELLVRRWLEALDAIPKESVDEVAYLEILIHYFTVWAEVIAWRQGDLTILDKYETQFFYIISLVKRYLDIHRQKQSPSAYNESVSSTSIALQPDFHIGTGLAHCIAIVIMGCRNSQIRRRALDILRTIDLSGVFDINYVFGFLQAVVDVEESRTIEILGKEFPSGMQSRDVPLEARVLDIGMGGATGEDGALCEFYRGDSGELFYAYRGSDGKVDVGSKSFDVLRGEQAAPQTFFDCYLDLDIKHSFFEAVPEVDHWSHQQQVFDGVADTASILI